MMRVVFGLVALSLAVVVLANVDNAAGQDKKLTAKEVMQKAMKSGLCGKVAGGKASDAEKKDFVELITALCAATPPKGDAASWKEKTSALLDAAKAADGKALKGSCAGCHKVHK